MHTPTHMHAHACTHMHVEHDKHAKHGCLHVSGHLQFLYMCVRAYACMHMHVGTSPHAPHPLPPTPHIQTAFDVKVGGVLSQKALLCKKCSCDPWEKIFLFLHWIPLDHI